MRTEPLRTHADHLVLPDLSEIDGFDAPLPLPSRHGAMAVRRLGDEPLRLTATRGVARLEGGRLRAAWGYVSGSASNPTLVVRRGQRARIEITNDLGEDTTVHWHGLQVPWTVDGHPDRAIPAGGTFTAELDVVNPAAMLWYHPHPHGHTAAQVAAGLAGLLIVEDDDDDALRAALDLELGVTDLPLVLRDERIDDGDDPVYAPDPMEAVMGHLGDAVYVNGARRPRLSVAARGYRLRLLNASNARQFRLALVRVSDGRPVPVQLLGVDGGFLEHPVAVETFDLGPAERADVHVDLHDVAVGERLALVSVGFDPMHHGMGREHGHHAVGRPWPADGAPVVIARFDVDRAGDGERRRVPDRLTAARPLPVVAGERRWELTLGSDPGGSMPAMRWEINGRTHHSGGSVELPGRAVERWVIRNAERSMPHPMHLHGLSFEVAARRSSPAGPARRDEHGRLPTDLGPKDTVMVWPGEEVDLLVDLTTLADGPQRLMFHCHLLEHEDSGMMLDLVIPR